MELKLKKDVLQYYELYQETPFSFETTQEVIVPDYCADVARVIDTEGMLLIQMRELGMDGRMEIVGTVKVSLLFVPEGAGGAAVLRFDMPFRTVYDGKMLEKAEKCMLQAALKKVDARLLNPRKLLLRADLSLAPVAYCPCSADLCVGVEEENVQVLEETWSCPLMTDVLEKELEFHEELQIPASRKGMRELLSGQVSVTPTETKIIGRKLVVKGSVAAEVFYRSQADELCTMRQEYGFSQILETAADEDRGSVKVRFEVVDCSFAPGHLQEEEDPYTVSLELRLRTVAEIYEEQHRTCVADLYSLDGTAALESEPTVLPCEVRTYTRKYSLRETVETATAVRQVLFGWVRCGNPVCSREGDSGRVQAPAVLHVVYSDENGSIAAAEWEVLLSAELELGENSVSRVSVSCFEEIQCVPAADGVEVRFGVLFQIEETCRRNCLSIRKAEVQEESRETPLPSIVLKRREPGESLWDLAKRYHSTCGDILQANGLENEEQLPWDRLLLIPRRRG